MTEFSPENMARIQDTIRARLVLAREAISQQTADLHVLIKDGIYAGLTTSDLAERSGLPQAEIEAQRASYR